MSTNSTDTTGAEIPLRSEIPTDMQWDLTPVYRSEGAWTSDEQRVREMLVRLPEFRGKLKQSGKQILAFLILRDQAGQLLDRLSLYAHCRADEDKDNSHFQALSEKANSLYTLFNTAISWSNPELVSIDPTRLRSFIVSRSIRANAQ
jgi:oligoendopeptidase F